ncbi:hypothetical protein SESBI_19569 [Sesbania bispinosa]|nr:hypothetical protein SESBI_19569 [Sesbania bispinosa]
MAEGQSSRKETIGEGKNGRGDRRAVRYNSLSGSPNGNRLNFAEVRRASQWGMDEYTPLNAKRGNTLKEVYSANLLDPHLPARSPKGPYKNRWCEFHRVQGHDTEQCWDLMNQIEHLIKDDYLKRYMSAGGERSGGEGPRRDNATIGRENTGNKQNEPAEENIRGMMTIIAGGFIGGGTTSSA